MVLPEPQLTALLRDRIRRHGPLPFVHFMDIALYDPGAGYYEHTTIGRDGDFYTSASTGGLFGKLLAFQFGVWLKTMAAGPFSLVEAGAHDGNLAADILEWLALNLPELCSNLRYTILESSPTRQTWQQRRLEKFAGQVQWRRDAAEIATGGIRGIVFSNELLDAFPVHRLGWDVQAQRWFEWGVGWREDRFVWERLGPVLVGLAEEMELAGLVMPAELLAVLPDGFTMELCPAARRWWKTAASSLAQGWLLTLDYGLTAEQFFHPQRADGTLRAYHQHRLVPEVLAQPGGQDLTAHINFTQLQRAGEQAGLRTHGLFSQAEFLTQIARQTWAPSSGFGEWTPNIVRQFQTLTHPNHLGRAFKVLAQERGAR